MDGWMLRYLQIFLFSIDIFQWILVFLREKLVTYTNYADYVHTKKTLTNTRKKGKRKKGSTIDRRRRGKDKKSEHTWNKKEQKKIKSTKSPKAAKRKPIYDAYSNATRRKQTAKREVSRRRRTFFPIAIQSYRRMHHSLPSRIPISSGSNLAMFRK